MYSERYSQYKQLEIYSFFFASFFTISERLHNCYVMSFFWQNLCSWIRASCKQEVQFDWNSIRVTPSDTTLHQNQLISSNGQMPNSPCVSMLRAVVCVTSCIVTYFCYKHLEQLCPSRVCRYMGTIYCFCLWFWVFVLVEFPFAVICRTNKCGVMVFLCCFL